MKIEIMWMHVCLQIKCQCFRKLCNMLPEDMHEFAVLPTCLKLRYKWHCPEIFLSFPRRFFCKIRPLICRNITPAVPTDFLGRLLCDVAWLVVRMTNRSTVGMWWRDCVTLLSVSTLCDTVFVGTPVWHRCLLVHYMTPVSVGALCSV